MSHFERLLEFYQSGSVPWDRAEPPPEVLAFVPTLPVGRALDLGCGLGRAALYLARLGWQVDGVDFIPQAITEATVRADQAGLLDKIRFHLGPVTQLGFLAGPYDFALDVGCAHSFDLDELRAYHQELLRLLKPGGYYLLFAHLNETKPEPEARRWLDETDLREIFEIGFSLERVEYGQTQVGDQPPWRSAWFWFKRVKDKREPMGSAAMKYLPDGQVDWGNMWDTFCELASAGGPPHRGTMLSAPADVDPQSEGYRWAVAELCRGIEAVSGLKAAAHTPGWIAIDCPTREVASWLAEAITQENVQAQAQGNLLLVPVAENFTLTGEIKNVITAVAKTTHYWLDHLSPEVKEALMVELWAKGLKEQVMNRLKSLTSFRRSKQ